MKFPSIATLGKGLLAAWMRWPLSILFAAATTVLLIRMSTDHSDFGEHPRMWAFIMSGYVGMLLTIAATVFGERRGWATGGKLLIQGVAVGLTVLFWYFLPREEAPRLIRYVVMVLAVHWLIAFLPYAVPGDGPVGFWDYNRKLFLRALQTALYTLVLYAGITLALLAIDQLFNAHLSDAYIKTWWILMGVFNPIFFLAGFPTVFARPDRIDDYPRGLKVFTQWVLLPLVTIYLAILYAYAFKILFTANWPSGLVTYLVLGFSVAGILALLLVWPLRNDEDNRWIRSYSKLFYLALLPLVLMLWVAIAKRVVSYGITEPRYYVLMLALWLTAIAGYFVFSGRKDIRVIPASLCVLALLSLWGPWGASSLSLANQMHRMKGLLTRDGRFSGGKIVAAGRPMPVADREELRSMAEYITGFHGYHVLQPWFRENLDSAMSFDAQKYDYTWEQARVVMRLIGVPEDGDNDDVATVEVKKEVTCNVLEDLTVLRTSGVDYVLPDFVVEASENDKNARKVYAFDRYSVGVMLDSSRHLLSMGTDSGSVIDVRRLENSIRDSLGSVNEGSLSQGTMTLGNARYRVVLTRAMGVRRNGEVILTGVRGYLLVLGK